MALHGDLGPTDETYPVAATMTKTQNPTNL